MNTKRLFALLTALVLCASLAITTSAYIEFDTNAQSGPEKTFVIPYIITNIVGEDTCYYDMIEYDGEITRLSFPAVVTDGTTAVFADLLDKNGLGWYYAEKIDLKPGNIIDLSSRTRVAATKGKWIQDEDMAEGYYSKGFEFVLEPGVYLFHTGTAEYNGHGFIVIVEGLSESSPADPPSPWAIESINKASRLNLVPLDMLDGGFTKSITRAQFTALAVCLYETVMDEVITGRVEFTDTSDINVQKAAAIGVVGGIGNGKFDPEATLTREQAAAVLSRLAAAIGKNLPKHKITFADRKAISAWATEAIGQMQLSGIMGGVGDNKFAPKGEYTKEQSIITILRLYEK